MTRSLVSKRLQYCITCWAMETILHKQRLTQMFVKESGIPWRSIGR